MKPLSEIADTIESTPAVLRSLLSPLDPEMLRRRPEPGEWCALEVIGHLIVTDGAAFRDRIAAIIAGEPEIRGFNPSLELTGRDFAQASLDELLGELTDGRAEAAAFVRSLDPADLERTAAYRGTIFRAGDFVHEWPFHDQDHLQQILAAVKPGYLPHMSAAMQQALQDD
ncbi:MAG: DinB family protein [Actinomycetota bacterium]